MKIKLLDSKYNSYLKTILCNLIFLTFQITQEYGKLCTICPVFLRTFFFFEEWMSNIECSNLQGTPL